MLDKQTAILLAFGAALLALTFYFYQKDQRFLEHAQVTDAVVTDKSRRSGSGDDSDSYSVAYEWPGTWNDRSITWTGRDSWSGGEEAWQALKPGTSTVKIAWVPTEDGKGTHSRLYEQGFLGIPWPSLIVGLLMTGGGVFRLYKRAGDKGARGNGAPRD